MVDGKRVYSETYDTPEIAREARERFVTVAGTAAASLSLEQGMQRVRDRNAVNRRSPATVRAYDERFRILAAHFGPTRMLVSIDQADCRVYLAARDVSASTVIGELRILGRIYSVCGLESPVRGMELPRKRKPESSVMHLADYLRWRDAMLNWAPRSWDTVSKHFKRDLLIPQIAFGLGLRRSEMARMMVKHLDAGRKTVRIIGKNDNRDMPVSTHLAAELVEWVGGRSRGSLLHTTPKNIEETFVRWNRRLGTKWYPHSLRHGFGTTLAENGAGIRTIMSLMGHTTPEMALRYVHSTDRVLRSAVENLLEH